jgi:two-component sensor histidine kinase/tetratricopeptide (TPR) repeat protein
LGIILLLFHLAFFAPYLPTPNAGDQILSAAATISKYTVAQKRLLAISTAQFTNFITQNNLDKDSVMSMARHMTDMPFLLPYNDGFADKTSGGEELINSGRIMEAMQFSKTLQGEQRIQLLLELGIWYLHQPGNNKKDLEKADLYIESASMLSTANKSIKWENECRFLLAELYHQQGNDQKSKTIFLQLVSSGQQDGNVETVARACQHMGTLLPGSDSMKRIYYQRSLNLYQKLQLKEKEIELTWDISGCDVNIGFNFLEKDLRQIIALMQSTGFKHVLYAENILTNAVGGQGRFMEAFEHANAALENMKWSGINAVAGSMYTRFGSTYQALGKDDEALKWYKKALDTRKNETHVFWYKSLFFATELLRNTHPEEALSLIDTITGQFPPRSVWEKLQILSTKGRCYEKLNKPGLADESYMALLELSNRYPLEDSYGELTGTYLLIGDFYISRPDVKKARLFLKKALINSQKNPLTDAGKYELLFKIDSLEGNYRSAMQDHIKYKRYDDSSTGADQRLLLDELTVKYAAGKKDQDIKLLRQHEMVQQAELKQNKLTRNIMIAGTALLSIILILLFSQFRLKQRTNKEMNKRNLALKQLVNEKEWLIKEVHHRVKNNLQTIISLLESQAAYLENDALRAIATSQNRIYTMSLIHQKLYQSEDIQTIDMASYIPELIKYLKDSFDQSDRIGFNLKIDPVNLDASVAIPLALIINEALTNSIKYAFPGNRHGEILISLREQEGDLLQLELIDNGVGMDINSIKAQPVSLGLQLIKGLTKEIHGDVSFKCNHGVQITVLFKKLALEYANILETDLMTVV